MKKVLVVLCVLTFGIAGCAGLTAREKGPLVDGYSTRPKTVSKSKGSASAASGKSPAQPQEGEEGGRIF